MGARIRTFATALSMMLISPTLVAQNDGSNHNADVDDVRSISGRVLKARGTTIVIEGEDKEAVPVQVTPDTSINGTSLEDLQHAGMSLTEEIQPGEDVNVEFNVRRQHGEIVNVAESVSNR